MKLKKRKKHGNGNAQTSAKTYEIFISGIVFELMNVTI